MNYPSYLEIIVIIEILVVAGLSMLVIGKKKNRTNFQNYNILMMFLWGFFTICALLFSWWYIDSIQNKIEQAKLWAEFFGSIFAVSGAIFLYFLSQTSK